MTIPFATISLLGLLVLVAAPGCSDPPRHPREKLQTTPNPQVEATYTIALFATMSPTTMVRNWQPICDHLAATAKLGLTLRIFKRYRDIYDQVLSSDIHLVVGGTLLYLAMHDKAGFYPLVRRTFADQDTNRSILVVRKDSEVKTLLDLQGRTIAFTDRTSTSGYLYPALLFARAGITNLETYFSHMVFTGNHESTLLAVLNREVEAAGLSNRVFARFPERNKKLRIIASSLEIPMGPIGCSRSVPPAHAERLRQALLHLGTDGRMRYHLQALGIVGFAEPDEATYEAVRRDLDLLLSLGLQLEDFL